MGLLELLAGKIMEEPEIKIHSNVHKMMYHNLH
jgi:hypothetical protein